MNPNQAKTLPFPSRFLELPRDFSLSLLLFVFFFSFLSLSSLFFRCFALRSSSSKLAQICSKLGFGEFEKEGGKRKLWTLRGIRRWRRSPLPRSPFTTHFCSRPFFFFALIDRFEKERGDTYWGTITQLVP